MSEFNLSDELRKLSYPYKLEFLLKEFIRLLKEYVNHYINVADCRETKALMIINEEIDKLAGDKLV